MQKRRCPNQGSAVKIGSRNSRHSSERERASNLLAWIHPDHLLRTQNITKAIKTLAIVMSVFWCCTVQLCSLTLWFLAPGSPALSTASTSQGRSLSCWLASLLTVIATYTHQTLLASPVRSGRGQKRKSSGKPFQFMGSICALTTHHPCFQPKLRLRGPQLRF